MDRQEILGMLNNMGMPRLLGQLHQAMLLGLTQRILGEDESNPECLTKDSNHHILKLLDHVGPGAASSAVEYAINHLSKSGRLRTTGLNGSYVHNTQLIHNNNDIGESADFNNVLRQFLLPRYAYLDFDRIIDPKHLIDIECGYPKFITPIMYRYMYDRDDVARRVVDILPDECWAVEPNVYETEDENVTTPFEEDWQRLCDDHNLMQYLYRIDRLAGIGHYGALLLGIDDGADLEKPIDEAELLKGMKRSVAHQERGLLYMRPFDEYLSFIHQYEVDVMHPRYGLPKFYNLIFLDMTIDAAGASIGTRLNRRVHWSRVVHVADNLQSSLVFGIPRMQPVFNRLLDLRKVKGCSAEVFWKTAFPGLAFEVNPNIVEDQPDYDKDKFREEIERFNSGLEKYIIALGFSVKSLTSQMPTEPQKYVELQEKAIAVNQGVPMRVWQGSEEGRLASSQDKLTWNTRLGRRIRMFCNPSIIRNVVDRFVAIGIMRPPASGKYFVDWGDLNKPTDEDKANLSLKWTQALSQYVATGMIHLVPPEDFLTLILGLKPSQALQVLARAKAAGGWDKLYKVDPDQGAGQNGKRQNLVSGGDKDTTTSTKPTPRNTADKQAEGKTS